MTTCLPLLPKLSFRRSFTVLLASNVICCLCIISSSQDHAQRSKTSPPGLDAVASGRCVCTDVKPFISDTEIDNGCTRQREWGKCDIIPGLYKPDELPEGWCQITCGRCTCCQSSARVAFGRNLTSFIWLAHHADRLNSFNSGADLLNPGFMHTVFAPTNTAVHEMLKTLGYGYLLRSPYPDPDQEMKSLFRKIVSAHLAPPLPGTEALWTSPFLVQGTTIRTEASSSSFSLQVSQGPNQAVDRADGIVLQASNGQASITARLLSGNHESCKSIIHVVDRVFPVPQD